MGIVRNILTQKDNTIHAVAPDTILFSALEKMYDKNISALLVIENNNLVGIFTERDYARKVVLKGKSSKEVKIHEIMTTNLITVEPDCKIEEAMLILTNKHIRHLPVMEGGSLIGIVSIGDVVKYLIEELQFIIGNLENYISHT